MLGFRLFYFILHLTFIIASSIGAVAEMPKLTPQTFQTAYNNTPTVTRSQVEQLGMSTYGFSAEYMKIIIGTTEREWYPLDLFLEYEWACCFINYRVMNYRPDFATDEGAYNVLAQWLPRDYYSRANIQLGYDTVTDDTLKAIYLAIQYLDRNAFSCSGDGGSGTYAYYTSTAYPDITVWYTRSITFTERTSSPAGTYNPCYMTNLYGASWNDAWNTCIYGRWASTLQPSAGANVIPNCTGYAQGRALEIYNECLNYNPSLTQTHPFVALNGDAGTWYNTAQSVGLPTNPTVPAPGAIMVWGDTNGAGHVEVIEKVNDNDTVITTGSAWDGWAFGADWCSMTRVRGDGNWLNGTMWGMPSNYYFIGFILNPADPDQPIPPTPPTPTSSKSKMWMFMKRRDLRPQYRRF